MKKLTTEEFTIKADYCLNNNIKLLIVEEIKDIKNFRSVY